MKTIVFFSSAVLAIFLTTPVVATDWQPSTADRAAITRLINNIEAQLRTYKHNKTNLKKLPDFLSDALDAGCRKRLQLIK